MAVPKHILIDIYRYTIGITGSVTVVFGVCKSVGKLKRTDMILSKAGRYTMQIYIIQCFFFKLFGVVFGKIKERFWNNIIFSEFLFRDIIGALVLCVVLFVFCIDASKIDYSGGF